MFQIALDPANPLAAGYGDTDRHLLQQQRRLGHEAERQGARDERGRLVRERHAAPQRLGLGPEGLDKAIEIVSADVGKGHVFLFGNELTNRSQPHGDFKLFFNALYLSVADGLK